MANQALKRLTNFHGKSHAVPHFGRDFGHRGNWRVESLREALGLGREHDIKVFTTFEAPGVWVSWMGSNGERYRHKFSDGLMNVDDDEFNALRVKVRLSTC